MTDLLLGSSDPSAHRAGRVCDPDLPDQVVEAGYTFLFKENVITALKCDGVELEGQRKVRWAFCTVLD